MATQLLPSDTTELVPADAINTTPRQDYYTALRDYVAGLSSPYGMYIPEVSQLLRSTAGSPTGRLGSGAYDVMASNPWAALTMDQNAPIDPSLLAAITSSVNPNAPYEQNVTYQFNPFKEGKYASSNAIDVLYNTPIRLTDAQGNTIMSGVGFQAAEQIAKAVQDAYGSGTKSEFRIDTGMPGDTTGDTFKTASIVSPEQNGLAQFIGTALPIVTSFIPGLNVLGKVASMAAAGGAGAAIQGKDPLKGALLAGATAGLINAPILPGGSSIGSAIGSALGVPATSAVKGGIDAAGNIVAVAPSATAQALSGFSQLGAGTLANAVLGSNIADYQQAFNEQAGALPNAATPSSPEVPAAFDPNEIVAAASRLQTAADAINVGAGIGQLAAMGLTPDQMDVARQYAAQTKDQIVVPAQKPIVPGIAPLLSNAMATLPNFPGPSTLDQAAPEPTEEPITVEGKKPIAPNYLELGLGSGLLNQFTSPPTLSQPEPTTLDTTQPKSLLDQIMKYGSLASLASNALGDLFGGGGGAGGVTTPYTSTLGPAPTFGRGTFQPYTGNYETYGQGPEWNFFTPTTTPAAAPTTQTYTPLI